MKKNDAVIAAEMQSDQS